MKPFDRIRGLLAKVGIFLFDAEWTEKQNLLSKDNFVDMAAAFWEAHRGGIRATGCGPCDMMQLPGESEEKIQGSDQRGYCVPWAREKILGASIWY